MKTSFTYLFATLILFVTSCSSEYDYSINTDPSNAKFITLRTNIQGTKIGLNQNIVLSLFEDENNIDLTEASTFYVNDEAIFGNEYSFQEIGTYTIYGSVNNINSNPISIEVVDKNYIVISESKVLKNQEVTFQLFSENGEDLTNSSSFIVNGNAISGNIFSSEIDDTYSVSVGDSNVNSESFTVFTPKRKVAIEDYTGTWCGWCPRVLLVIDKAEEVSDDLVVLAIHNNDEMQFEQEEAIRDAFNVGNSLPKLFVNRTQNIVVSQDVDIQPAVDYISSLAGTEVEQSIAIQTKLNGTDLRVEVDLLSSINIPSNHKLAVYLYQDKLIYDQTNYYVEVSGHPLSELGNPIPNYEHNHVLEASLTDNVLGRELSNSVEPFKTHNEVIGTIDLNNYAHTDNGNSFDVSNFGIAVFLVDENNNAVNAQSVKAGENIGFE
ncbi:Omp28-related outer membrane protein [Mesonia sp. K7]|uniref:Omp28-related outer membrane protein n=1 Tax=Mesonia sp. K7 TaxID=2218606 RepID=UPI000DA7DCED|nr:Omp28-related outer membrane protein [Mesonia sp. K7]PZD77245.1 hypothetical protein DNG35_09235 [Mesonia sp. K7]